MCLISILVFLNHKVFICWTHVNHFTYLPFVLYLRPSHWLSSLLGSVQSKLPLYPIPIHRPHYSILCQCFPGPHYHGLIFAFFTILLPKKIHILKRGWKFWAKWVQSCHLEVNFQPLSFFSLPWMIKLPPSSICAGKAVSGVVWPPLHLPPHQGDFWAIFKANFGPF